ncbi:MAG: redoxin domain-containing protein [Deltaproteobacteria bacterium]|jgi:peroxiredoxin|nr:redoxin domain-containing protein [Deltaproteobacteria bacterium]MBW2531443.1 redoxin domain-containing protein [Deltaproteobacteria bacterium]
MGSIPLVGDAAPDFVLDDAEGNPQRLASFRGERKVVLVFNRGFA